MPCFLMLAVIMQVLILIYSICADQKSLTWSSGLWNNFIKYVIGLLKFRKKNLVTVFHNLFFFCFFFLWRIQAYHQNRVSVWFCSISEYKRFNEGWRRQQFPSFSTPPRIRRTTKGLDFTTLVHIPKLLWSYF
jgi:hypothetical protein